MYESSHQMSRFKVKTNRENMLKARYLRSIIREEIINQNRLYESTMGPLKLSYKNKLLFGDVSATAVYPGKNDDEIILKLPSGAGGSFTLDTAVKLGGRPLTDDYFSPGTPFVKAIGASGLSAEALRRNIAIAKIKNQSDLDKSRAFNRSQHFFVAVDSNNKSLKDADLVAKQQEEKVAGPSFLDLMMNDPLGGYGAFIDTLPPRERDEFINDLVTLNSMMGLASAGGTMTDTFAKGGGGAKGIAGVAGAVMVGPSLALSSIAYNRGNNLEAALYLASAVINTWFSSSQMLGGVAAWRQGRTLLSSIISFKGSGSAIAAKMADIKNLKDLKSVLTSIAKSPDLLTDIKAALAQQGINNKLLEAITVLVKNEHFDELNKLSDTLKTVLIAIFAFSADAAGAVIDSVILLETQDIVDPVTKPAEPETAAAAKAAIYAKLSSINAKFKSITGKLISSYRPEQGQTLLVNYETGTSRSVDNLIIGNVLNLADDKIKVNSSSGNLVLAVPDYIFDTFDQIKSFKQSSFANTFSGTSSQKFYKDGKIIYMLDN